MAQNGKIRGTVSEKSTGETLISVSIFVEGTEKKTFTDLDGKYNLDLAPGTYSIKYKFISFAEQIINDITVKANKVTTVNVSMTEATTKLKVFVITEKLNQNNEAALLTKQKKSANVIDAVSAQSISKRGDGNAAAAVQRVTGVSVEGGKYVYVRGLGDRYTKTILNGMEIPGLDPDRNNVQMDIFPTNLIDNLVVYKSFTPDLPADFTGGMVDITTKSFPDEQTMKVSGNIGVNSQTHLKNNFTTYKGSTTDKLGFDAGTRTLPLNPNQKIPDPTQNNPNTTTFTRAFGKEMGVSNKTALFDRSASFSYGNQKNHEKYDEGFIFNLNYQNNFQLNENSEVNEYGKDPEKSSYELLKFRTSTGTTGVETATWSALLGKSYKLKKSKYALNLMHIQNSEKTAARLVQKEFETNPSTVLKDNLTFTQRSISNANIAGEHNIKKWRLNWKLSPTYSSIKDPDIRTTALEQVGENQYELNKSVGADITRIYRDLTELSLSAKTDLVYDFKSWNGLDSKLKFGALNTYKKRDFEILNYLFDIENKTTYNGFNPDSFFQDDFIWTVEKDAGLYAKGQKELANTFSASQNIFAAYLMNELNISKKIKAIYGVRMERAIYKYTGVNNTQTVTFNDSTVLNEINFLPALNFIYKAKENMNIRASYTGTLARPSFKEKSISQIYDPLLDRRYNGNIDLEQTSIQNLDVRWEYFMNRNQMFSVSGFYKYFNNPIEIVSFDVAPNEIKPINAGEASILGIELEVRKNIAFLNNDKQNLALGANYTYVKSRIDMTKVLIDKGTEKVQEFTIRQENARTGETIDKYRPMFGQSPYIVNAFLNYTNNPLGLNANISYNVQGKRLAVIGIGSLPDVYEQSFHNLSLKVSKKFGKDNKWAYNVNIQNILNDTRERLYESYKAKTQIYDLFIPGRSITIGISYKIK